MDLIEGRAVRIESDGPTLEALLHLPVGEGPFPGIVVCHPHPQFGGEMLNNVVGALVRAANGVGVAALRFNFRGVGQSEGSFDAGKGEQDDARAALGCLRSQAEIDASRTGIAGYSFGATAAINVASGRNDLACLVAVSAPTAKGAKVEVRLLCPTLFVSGDRDEYCDMALLTEYAPQMGDRVEVAVMEGVDHFWWGSDERLIEAVQGFLRRAVVTAG